jgi:hypothetical protein
MKVKVIELPKENLTAQFLEQVINEFLEVEKPIDVKFEFNSEFGFLIIIYQTIEDKNKILRKK